MWEDRIQAWMAKLKAWEGRFKAWEDRIQTWEGLGGADGWTNGQTDKQKSPCVLQDFAPFGAPAQNLYLKNLYLREIRI